MGAFHYLTKLALIIFATNGIIPSTSVRYIKSIGSFDYCGHGLKGTVFVKNEREVIIQGFHYDGTGAGGESWFHAMKRGILGGVHSSDESYYYILPFPGDNCESFKGKVFQGEDITLILPVSIKELETIGIMHYEFCVNFGHISIPHNLEVPAAPAGLLETKLCPQPAYKPCYPKWGGIRETLWGGPECIPTWIPVDQPTSPAPTRTKSPSKPETSSWRQRLCGSYVRVRFNPLAFSD